jgi:ATP-dependent Clp protease adapter protein ClpS
MANLVACGVRGPRKRYQVGSRATAVQTPNAPNPTKIRQRHRFAIDSAHALASRPVPNLNCTDSQPAPRSQPGNGSTRRAEPSAARFSSEAHERLQRAAIHVLSSDSAEVTAALVLLAFLEPESPEPLRTALHGAGLSSYALRVNIAQGPDAVLDPPAPGESADVHVVFHNDPFTTVEFVRAVLTDVFQLTEAQAQAFATEVHEHGFGTIAAMPAAVAAERIAELRHRALASGFPLRVSVEPRG